MSDKITYFVANFGDRKSKGVLQNIKIPPTHKFLTGPVTYNELSNELTNLSAEYLFSFLKDLETMTDKRDFSEHPHAKAKPPNTKAQMRNLINITRAAYR